jgi:hypothetical protein
MRQMTITIALATSMLACGSPARTDLSFTTDIIGNPCPADTHVEGVLVEGTHAGTAIGATPLIWPMSYSARRVAGGAVEVVDGDGTVIATTGGRYRIGGHYSTAFNGFWACAHVVIPR